MTALPGPRAAARRAGSRAADSGSMKPSNITLLKFASTARPGAKTSSGTFAISRRRRVVFPYLLRL
eukprot:513837-Pyramimonas_sp.AAC.1